jgi:FkbM family methyltransferase
MPENKILNQIIGKLMKIYRNSPLHSQKAGEFLAKALSLVLRFRKSSSVITKNINGIEFELDVDQVIDSSLYFSGTFEEAEEKVIASILKPGMFVMDIGANFGYHTFRMAQLVQPGGWVYAIEPTSWAFQKLTHNAKLNQHLNNISFLKTGLSDKNIGKVQASFQSSYRIDGRQFNLTEEVTLINLDTLICDLRINRLDFVKMDVDGYEGKIIRGANEILKTLKPYILMEISPSAMLNNGDDPDNLITMLLKLGYWFKTNRMEMIADLRKYCKEISRNSSAMILAIPSNINQPNYP